MHRNHQGLARSAAILGLLALTTAAHGAAYTTKLPFDAAKQQALTVRPDKSLDPLYPTGPRLDRAGVTPSWIKPSTDPSIQMSAIYQIDLGSDAPVILKAELVSKSPCLKGDADLLMLLAHLRDCTMRISIDLDNDQKFEPSEIREGTLDAPDVDPNQMVRFVPRRFAIPFEIPALERKLLICGAMSQNIWNNWNGMSSFGMWHGGRAHWMVSDSFQNLFNVQSQWLPSSSALLEPLDNNGKLVLCLGGDASSGRPGLRPIGYLRVDRNAGPIGINWGGWGVPGVSGFDQPFTIGDKPWIITEVSDDLKTIRVAPQIVTATKPDEALTIGAAAPAWTRPDLLTRHLYVAPDLAGKYIVLCAGGTSGVQAKYLSWAMSSQILRRATAQVKLIYIDDNFQMDSFMQQLAGQEELNFGLISDRDYTDGNLPTISSLFKLDNGNGGLVVIGPDGKLLFRAQGKAPETLNQALKALPQRPQDEEGPAQKSRAQHAKAKHAWWCFWR